MLSFEKARFRKSLWLISFEKARFRKSLWLLPFEKARFRKSLWLISFEKARFRKFQWFVLVPHTHVYHMVHMSVEKHSHWLSRDFIFKATMLKPKLQKNHIKEG